ncbi:MAG: DNA polymerase IV [Clostridia bacterium]|nr:DNA polymerase IV [Clostridia bacterium]
MRTILHSDLNNFYASVECLRRPEIRKKPVVVVGAKEDRHGIVLAKNMIAKRAGVKTGDVYWEARQKCGGELVEVQADFAEYLKVSKEVRKIYEDYTDRIEAFGIDECWLDVSQSLFLFGSGAQIAHTIRERVKKEIGITVSVGVSWNKVFAKLGSDMEKPDAVTEITQENYKETVWSLPAEELLYVGSATKQKLHKLGIKTIGQLAAAEEALLVRVLGKWGSYLSAFANGKDNSPVVTVDEEENIKSIGNSLTVYRDLKDDEDVRMVIHLLADSVGARMREAGLMRARTVHVSVRASDLSGYRKQGKLHRPTCHANELAQKAFALFREMYPWENAVRSVGLSVSDFCFGAEQLDLFGSIEKDEKQKRIDAAVDKLRKKYGNNVIQSAIVYKDPKIRDLDIKGEHVIHPYGFFKNGT